MGNDTFDHCTEEGLPKHLLPRGRSSWTLDRAQSLWQLTCWQKQTRDTYQRADPAFTYLLSFFLFLSGIAWGVAYAEHFSSTLWVAFVFVAIHFLLLSLVVSTAMFFLVGRVLGRRHQGLFGPPSGGGESLEFGYCFDVSILFP